MNMRRLILAGLALATLVALLSLALRTRPGSAEPAERGGPLAYRFAWPQGTRYVYDLTWSAQQNARVAEAGLSGGLGLEGRLVLRSFGERAGKHVLGLSFASLAKHEMRLAGKPLLGDDAALATALVGPEAFVELEASGRVRGVSFAEGAPAVFQQVVMGLVGELEVVVPEAPAASWTASVQTLSGRALVGWRVRGLDPARIERHTLRYEALTLLATGAAGEPKIDSLTEVALAPAGHLEKLSGHEEVSLAGASSKSRIALALAAVERFDAGTGPDLARLEWRTLGQPVSGADAERRLLEARVDDMTPERFFADLQVALAGGKLSDHDRWLWQAVGLLELHPELCARLVPLFSDPRTDGKGRALLADLLASAGHAEAQAALREVLASDAAHADRAYGLLLQRTSLLAKPDADTVSFVAAVMDEAAASGDAHVRYAAAWSLGAAAGRIDESEAAPLSARLQAELATAGEGAERAALLGALGNTGRRADAAAIAAHTHDDDPDVRAAALSALHRSADDQLELLMERLTDEAMQVKAAALASLAEAHLSEPHYARLAAYGISRVLPPAIDAPLLDLIARQPYATSPALRSLLTLIVERHETEPSIAARARALLARTS
jgi:hypothetical protein